MSLARAQRARRVAVLADVHGSAIAMAATSAEVVFAEPDIVVFAGDLTLGGRSQRRRRRVVALRDSVGGRTMFVRGNAERALSELRNAPADRELTARERWMLAEHAPSTLDGFAEFAGITQPPATQRRLTLWPRRWSRPCSTRQRRTK